MWHGAWSHTSCTRTGSVEEGGKWWCKQHAPSTEAKKKAERESRWQANDQARDRTLTLAAELRLTYGLDERHVWYSGKGEVTVSDVAAQLFIEAGGPPPPVPCVDVESPGS